MHHFRSKNKKFLTSFAAFLRHFHVCRWIVGLDERINGFFDHTIAQLGFGQLRPNAGLVTTFGEFVRSIQISDLIDENLKTR